MKNLSMFAAAVLAIWIAVPAPAYAQSAQSLPLPDSPVATDIPGARELPDPSLVYKVVFDIGNNQVGFAPAKGCPVPPAPPPEPRAWAPPPHPHFRNPHRPR